MIEFRHLRYFLAVADELHFGRAAERLHMAQPPLSQQIQRLESMVGVQLFVRTRHSVRLTPAGEVFASEVRPLFESLERSVQHARHIESGWTGSLTIGFLSSAPYTVLPAILRAYREAFPGVTLDLRQMSASAQVEALQLRQIDIGLLRPIENDSVVKTQRLMSEPFVLVVPNLHPLVSQDDVSASALRDEPFIMVPHHRGTFGKIVEAFCEAHGFTPRVAMEAAEMHTVVGLVSAGLGIAMVPASIQNLRLPGVVYRPILDAPLAQTDLAWRQDATSKTIASFVSIAMAIVAQEMAVNVQS